MKRTFYAIAFVALGSSLGLTDVVHAQSSTAGESGNSTTAASTSVTEPPSRDELLKRADQLKSRIDALDLISVERRYTGAQPGTNANVPSGFGSFSGSVGIGVGYQNSIRFNDDRRDGTMGISVGFGDSRKGTGLEVGFNVLDLAPFGDTGSINVKLHRRLSNESSVSLGLDNVLSYGGSDTAPSVYTAYSRLVNLSDDQEKAFSRLYFTVGAGNGRFRKEDDVRIDKKTINAFGSVATNFSRQVNGFAEWTGQDLNVGLSIIPFKKLPIVLTPAFVDLTGSAGSGTRFTLGAGYSFQY